MTRGGAVSNMMWRESLTKNKRWEIDRSKKFRRKTAAVNQSLDSSLPSITKSMNSNISPEYKSLAQSTTSLINCPSIGKNSSNDTYSD